MTLKPTTGSTGTTTIDYQSDLRDELDRRVADWARPLPRPARGALLALSGLCAILFVAACAYAAVHLRVLPDSLGRVADPDGYKFHFHRQAVASRAALLLLAASLALLALARWDRFVRLMRTTWLAVGHPMNLAIYRVVLFATILLNLDNDNGKTQILLFAGLPKELFIPPTGMEHLLRAEWFRDLINPRTAEWAYWLMNAFCVTAILGLFSRTSAALASLMFVFAAGIPQYFGQCNHFHHMFWSGAILAASRCGDYLSIDALLAARRRADRGVTAPPAPSWAYSLPLRFVWLAIALCYFFPGLWKYWNAGLAWAFGDHFMHLAEWKWINMGLEMKDGQWQGDWHPLFRLDKYPLLYKPAALTALIFELSFPVLIFFPRLRYLAVAMGVGFHRMIALTMRIPFFTLQTSYVAFVEWDRLFAWLGRGGAAAKLTRGLVVLFFAGVVGAGVTSELAGWGLFESGTYYVLALIGVVLGLAVVPEAGPIVFAYDGGNPSARRSVAMLRALDLRGNVEYRDDAPASVGARTTVKGATLTGAAALRALAARNPILWLVWPLVYVLLPEPTRTADAPPVTPAAGAPAGPRRVWPVLAMSAFILLPNLYLGIKRQYHGWPFACYPLFEKIRTHVKPDFDVVALDAAGQVIPWDEKQMMDLLTRPRYSTMCRRVRENKDPAQLHAFWKMLSDYNPKLRDAKTVQFWIRTRLSAPEQFTTAAPVKEELVHQVKLTPQGLVPDYTVTSTSHSPTTDE